MLFLIWQQGLLSNAENFNPVWTYFPKDQYNSSSKGQPITTSPNRYKIKYNIILLIVFKFSFPNTKKIKIQTGLY